MSHYSERVHIVPVSLDPDQIEKVFAEVPADRVYILDNENPKGMVGLAEKPLERVKSVVRERTGCFGNDEVTIEKIDFYHYREAVVDIFRIIIREKERGNEIILNLSGGTKPVAIALFLASSFADSGQMVYAAREYKSTDGDSTSSDVISPFFENPLNPININKIIPENDAKRKILVGLLEVPTEKGMTDLLISMGKITESPPENKSRKEERNRTIQRYHKHAESLEKDGLVTKSDSKYSLSETGNLIARLVEVKDSVEVE